MAKVNEITEEEKEALSQYKNIWVFVEQTGGVAHSVSFELLTKAREQIRGR